MGQRPNWPAPSENSITGHFCSFVTPQLILLAGRRPNK